jgi:hypothetical protein
MAIEFGDGAGEYIGCGSGATLDGLFAAGGSLAFWLNPAAVSNFVDCIGKDDSTINAGGWRVVVVEPGANVAMSLYYVWTGTDGEWTTPVGSVTAGVWAHWCITYDAQAAANNPIIYKNGVVQTLTEVTSPTTAASSDAAYPFEIGRVVQTYSRSVRNMEDVRAYKRILTQEEVSALVAGYRGPLGSEVGWWSLSDAQVVTHWDGDSLATTDVIPDMSPNGNDGTPQGTPTARASEAPRFGAMLG